MAQTNFVEYQMLNDAYGRTVEMLNRLGADWQSVQGEIATSQSEALKEFRDKEAGKLVQRAPEFGRDDYYQRFWNEAVSGAGRYYGYSPQELEEGMNDHRQYLVLRDALAYRRIKARQKTQGGLPKTGQRRTPAAGSQRRPQSEAERNFAAAQERFRKNPTARNAIDLVE